MLCYVTTTRSEESPLLRANGNLNLRARSRRVWYREATLLLKPPGARWAFRLERAQSGEEYVHCNWSKTQWLELLSKSDTDSVSLIWDSQGWIICLNSCDPVLWLSMNVGNGASRIAACPEVKSGTDSIMTKGWLISLSYHPHHESLGRVHMSLYL
jgi:hypothetical protein